MHRWTPLICLALFACEPTVECTDDQVRTTSNTCADLPGDYDGPPIVSGPNWGILDGDVFPSNLTTDPDSTVQKHIDVEIVGLPAGLELGAAVVVNYFGSLAHAIIPVTNIALVTKCLVVAENIRFYDGGGAVVAEDDAAGVLGSAHRLDTTDIVVESCLVGGQRGFFVSQIDVDIEDISSATLTFGDIYTDLFTEYPRSVQPVSYTEKTDVPGAISVDFSHSSGSQLELEVGSFGAVYILVDGDDNPLWFDWLKTDHPTGLIDQGETITFENLSSPTPREAGSRIWAYVGIQE